MPRLRTLSGKEAIKILTGIGFEIHHVKGSHYHLINPKNNLIRVVVPYHSFALAPKTLKSIIDQAYLNDEQKKKFYR